MVASMGGFKSRYSLTFSLILSIALSLYLLSDVANDFQELLERTNGKLFLDEDETNQCWEHTPYNIWTMVYRHFKGYDLMIHLLVWAASCKRSVPWIHFYLLFSPTILCTTTAYYLSGYVHEPGAFNVFDGMVTLIRFFIFLQTYCLVWELASFLLDKERDREARQREAAVPEAEVPVAAAPVTVGGRKGGRRHGRRHNRKTRGRRH